MSEKNEVDTVSVSGELTETGVKASIKSRAVSAWDRLFGAKADKRRAPIDAEVAETTAISAARVKMIEALGELGVDRLKSDPEFAARAMENFIPSLLRKQGNKDAVLELAAEDLRQNPGTEEEAASGPDKLDDAFLNRFERYAEDATDDEIRERWAKVLATEIRKPGTFSGKVLRVIDELDQSVAQEFSNVCSFRMGDVIPKMFLPDLEYMSQIKLVTAGLIAEPGLGQVRQCTETTDSQGVKLWFWVFEMFGLAAPDPVGHVRDQNTIRMHNGSQVCRSSF
ncbi:DUF2806 domain-containing protein [Mesorhizobium sp.]|uniref:DUF2806 domain-containing protein n=1 Tax=Mesorhizobium sp. TaxID=1871066 RepID=UPI000FEA0675|nr:DUF2806 domain-containing protein [Mesorhizobium sp.]RWP32520.1 MAG: DUF2806 domain-containing protein [Mesorhizobium sp.]